MPDDPTPDDPTGEAVRRLLADARHTEPMPTEIADRLDRVLADLGPSREEPRSETAVVVPLASRRRRRLATGLVAAAAVVVAGVTLSGVTGGLDGLTSDSNDSAQEAGSPEFAGSGEDQGSLSDQGESMEESAPAASPSAGTIAPDADGGSEPRLAPPTVRPDRFEQDALAARQQAGATFDSLSDLGCGGVPLEGQTVTVVRYADRQGYLVYSVSGPDQQRVDLFLCPEGELERRASIPAP